MDELERELNELEARGARLGWTWAARRPPGAPSPVDSGRNRVPYWLQQVRLPMASERLA